MSTMTVDASTRWPSATSHFNTRTVSSLAPSRGAETICITSEHADDDIDDLLGGRQHFVLEMPGAGNRHRLGPDGAAREPSRGLLRHGGDHRRPDAEVRDVFFHHDQ